MKCSNFVVHVLFVKLRAVVALKAAPIHGRVVNSVFLARTAAGVFDLKMSLHLNAPKLEARVA
jgi:hypothetical protein